jgi:multiple sugar transport system permease protein
MRKAGLVIAAALLAFPIYMMAQGSFQPIRGVLHIPPMLWPMRPTLENYALVFGQPFLLRWAASSLVVVAGYVVVGIAVNGAAGYVFAMARFPGKEALFVLLIGALLISRQMMIIPQFVVVRALGLREHAAVIAMASLWPVGIFLFRNYFESIPRSLAESARIDGAGEARIFARVMLPLSAPVLGAAVAFKGMEALSDYIWQMLNLQSEETRTLLVGLAGSVAKMRMQRITNNIGYELAVGTVLLVPLVVVFALASRYFVRGLALGGVKE